MLRHRWFHWLTLIGAMAVLTLPNLGAHSLWDVDEGVNAEAAREMLEVGNWIKPTFNYELRTAKPAMLYWLQMTSYSLFGIDEWSARLPSVLASMLTVLLVYELGRNMFDRRIGLLSGLVLASCIEFCVLSHSASPDAVLLACLMLAFSSFWFGSVDGGRSWFIPFGIACGLATLTKGPIGLGLPGLIVLVYLLWNRELRKLWDTRLFWGLLAFLATAAPWYVLVTLETRGEWASTFFGRENLTRFMTPMENHSGPIVYHILGLFVFFAPWCIFLGGALWYGTARTRASRYTDPSERDSERTRRAYRLLIVWFAVWLSVFSVAATKLPNYVLPLYPAIAILTACFAERWRKGEIAPPRWVMPTAIFGLALVGGVFSLGLLVAGGTIVLPKARVLPGLSVLAWIGLVPLAGSAACVLVRRHRERAIGTIVLTSIAFVSLVAAFAPVVLDAQKSPRALIESAGASRPNDDVRLGSLYCFHPSMVFYAQREVKKLEGFEGLDDFLSLPLPVYVFVTETQWDELSSRVTTPTRVAARHFDFLKNSRVVLVTNSPE